MRKSTNRDGVGKTIILAFIVTLMVKLFFFDFIIAEGTSMTPAIKPGAILIVFKAYYGIRVPWPGYHRYVYQWGIPQTGDILVFYTPNAFEIVVKRCGEVLPGGSFYALGDNDAQSYDSRMYGPVPKENIIGKVLGKTVGSNQ